VYNSSRSIETVSQGSVNSLLGSRQLFVKGFVSLRPFLDGGLYQVITLNLVNFSEEFSELFVLSHCLRERLLCLKGHFVSPVMVEHEPSDVTHGVVVQNVLDGDKILERFRHLKAFNVEMASVPEVLNPLVAVVIGLTLGDLIIVVREFKVDTARVDVHRSLLEDL
jgi:hypothetical protein